MNVCVATLAIISLSVPALSAIAESSALIPQTPIEVSGGPGHFDFISFDGALNRVLACHPGSKQLVVLDVKTGRVTSIDTGAVNGVAIDSPDNCYYTAGGNQDVIVIDRTSLKKIADIPTTGPCDDVVYDPKSGTVYVDHDDGTEVWMIDSKTNKIAGAVTVAGAPEVLEYDPATDRLYQNIKPTNQVQVIDPSTNAVTATWSTTPAESPHGLALDVKRNCLYSAGKNGTLVAVELSTGKSDGSCDIASGVDQIAYDPTADRVYCACAGAVSIVEPTSTGLTHIADITVAKGGHSVAIDPSTHSVWIAYSNDKGSYLQEFRQTGMASR